MRVVTDSTACLPADLVSENGLTVVPLQVVLAGRALAEGIEVTSVELAQAMLAGQSVTTSRPAPETFVQVYRDVAAAGAAGIVSVHLSGGLSGTVEAARIAARAVTDLGIAVEVVDSRSVASGLGFAALSAAAAAAAGASTDAVAQIAEHRARASQVWIYVDTLEYLRKGGRIGAGIALLGSALAVKPLLRMADGELTGCERVRTASRAMARLEEIVVARTLATQADRSVRTVDLGVHHLGCPGRAEALATRLRERLPDAHVFSPTEIGAVLAAHTGPGTLGVVLSPHPF